MTSIISIDEKKLATESPVIISTNETIVQMTKNEDVVTEHVQSGMTSFTTTVKTLVTATNNTFTMKPVGSIKTKAPRKAIKGTATTTVHATTTSTTTVVTIEPLSAIPSSTIVLINLQDPLSNPATKITMTTSQVQNSSATTMATTSKVNGKDISFKHDKESLSGPSWTMTPITPNVTPTVETVKTKSTTTLVRIETKSHIFTKFKQNQCIPAGNQ